MCFFFPSIWEGLGISLLEAQASGVKCVVSDVIKDEVCVTNSIKKISLQANVDDWVKEIIDHTSYDREKKSSGNIERLKEAGFARKTTAQMISAYYRR